MFILPNNSTLTMIGRKKDLSTSSNHAPITISPHTPSQTPPHLKTKQILPTPALHSLPTSTHSHIHIMIYFAQTKTTSTIPFYTTQHLTITSSIHPTPQHTPHTPALNIYILLHTSTTSTPHILYSNHKIFFLFSKPTRLLQSFFNLIQPTHAQHHHHLIKSAPG